MSHGAVGADVEELQRLAQQFDHAATRLQQLAGTVGTGIRISAWVGLFAVRFRHTWDSEYSVKLRQAADLLHRNAVLLRAEAQQQSIASNSNGTASIPRATMPGASDAGGGRSSSSDPLGVGDLLASLWPADAIGTIGDVFEVWKGWKIDDLPGGGFLGSVVKGIGLGSAASSLYDSMQHSDWGGAGAAAVDGVATFVSAPVSLLWTGLSEEIFFFIPRDHAEQDDFFAWLEHERGVPPADWSERYSGFQGFINLGNDNAARKAPWLVDGADKLMEKPAEWLYNIGIKL